MNWTDAQREAIELRNKNILVSAAAGSGKTAVLVERIKTLLLVEDISLDEMLIVTFSNAAASEMREKIVRALSKEIAENNPQTEDFARKQLSQIHNANISTFHAFSMEVIKRYFHLIDREPNFKICDEAQKSILQSKALDVMFGDFFEAQDEGFLWFLKEYSEAKTEENVKEMILGTHEFIQSIPDSYNWLDEMIENLRASGDDFYNGSLIKEIHNSLLSQLKYCYECFEKIGEILENHGVSSIYEKWKVEAESIKSLIDAFNNIHSYEENFQVALNMLANIKFQTYRATKEEKELYEEIKEQVAELRDLGKSIIKKLVSDYALKSFEEYIEDINETYESGKCLARLVKEFDARYRAFKDEKSLIDFSDIEHFALEILKHEEAALEYRNKFKYIFIDEYQDSNLVQETLICRIKRDNNLFMVGDVKQSIYKFRLAEPEIFIGKYEAFKKDSGSINKVIDLNKNFRSKGSIISSVNDVFSKIMTREVTGLDYDDAAALYQGVEYSGNLDYRTEIHLVDNTIIENDDIDEEIADMKKMEVEAYHAAQVIKNAIGQPYYDAKSKKIKNFRLRDMVILLRGAKGTAEIFVEALLNEGIPSFADVGDGYFNTVEIEVFLNLLRVIVNYKQDIPLISVLKSSIFAFTLEELIKIRIENRKNAYAKAFERYCDLGQDLKLKEKCRCAHLQMKEWSKESSYMPLEDFLWKLMRDTGYDVYTGSLPGGVQRQANLRALIDKAVQFQSNQGRGLFQFILYIEAIKKEKVPMGQVKLLGEKDDVVRIMTIHKSKGLEFPLVLIGGLGKKFQGGSKKNSVTFHKDLGMGLRLMNREKNCYKKTMLQSVIAFKKNKEELAEDIRVLYVAFTRAMDRLVLMGTSGAGKCYLNFLMPFIEDTKLTVIHHNRNEIQADSGKQSSKVSIIEDVLNSASKANDKDLQELIFEKLSMAREHELKLNVSSRSEGAKSKYSVSELNKNLLEENDMERITLPKLDTPLYKQKAVKYSSAERGTFLHTFMEQIDFKRMENTENINIKFLADFKDDLVNRELLLEKEAQTIDLKKVLNFFKSEIGIRAAKANKLFKEKSFNLIKEHEGNRVIVQGTIDCFFEEDGKYVLIDYKSNYIPKGDSEEALAQLVENYRGQMEIYKEALEKIKGKMVKEVYLYLFILDSAVELTWN